LEIEREREREAERESVCVGGSGACRDVETKIVLSLVNLATAKSREDEGLQVSCAQSIEAKVSEAAWRRSGSSVGPDDQGKTDALAPVCFTTYLLTYLPTYLPIYLPTYYPSRLPGLVLRENDNLGLFGKFFTVVTYYLIVYVFYFILFFVCLIF
jgi:hypothetical protein